MSEGSCKFLVSEKHALTKVRCPVSAFSGLGVGIGIGLADSKLRLPGVKILWR